MYIIKTKAKTGIIKYSNIINYKVWNKGLNLERYEVTVKNEGFYEKSLIRQKVEV